MRRIWWMVIILGLSACIFQTKEPQMETAVCNPDSGHLFSSAENGYCFVYPEDYCWFPGQIPAVNSFVSMPPADTETNQCPDTPMLFHQADVWLGVSIEPANGRTLSRAVAEMIPDPDADWLEKVDLTVAGETAVQINNMPGQDISRELLFIHDDQLFRLSFVPASVDYGDRFSQMETLYSQVIKSFHFLPTEDGT